MSLRVKKILVLPLHSVWMLEKTNRWSPTTWIMTLPLMSCCQIMELPSSLQQNIDMVKFVLSDLKE